MKVEICLTGAMRRGSTGPQALYWEVAVGVSRAGQLSYEGVVGVFQKAPNNFRIDGPIVGDNLPDWLPADLVCERVYWYVLNQLSDAIELADGTLSDVLVVDAAIVDEFEVIDGTWHYEGMRQLVPLE